MSKDWYEYSVSATYDDYSKKQQKEEKERIEREEQEKKKRDEAKRVEKEEKERQELLMRREKAKREWDKELEARKQEREEKEKQERLRKEEEMKREWDKELEARKQDKYGNSSKKHVGPCNEYQDDSWRSKFYQLSSIDNNDDGLLCNVQYGQYLNSTTYKHNDPVSQIAEDNNLQTSKDLLGQTIFDD